MAKLQEKRAKIRAALVEKRPWDWQVQKAFNDKRKLTRQCDELSKQQVALEKQLAELKTKVALKNHERVEAETRFEDLQRKQREERELGGPAWEDMPPTGATRDQRINGNIVALMRDLGLPNGAGLHEFTAALGQYHLEREAETDPVTVDGYASDGDLDYGADVSEVGPAPRTPVAPTRGGGDASMCSDVGGRVAPVPLETFYIHSSGESSVGSRRSRSDRGRSPRRADAAHVGDGAADAAAAPAAPAPAVGERVPGGAAGSI